MFFLLGLTLLLSLSPGQVVAKERVGLVLSGGAARGLAHIGVIRALEEQGVEISAIAGTSMGAVVGSLYASGYSTEQLEQLATELDWREALSDTPDRRLKPYRRKQDDRDFLVKQKISFKDDGSLGLPIGVLQGQNLNLLLEKLLAKYSAVEHFDQLPIPFRAVAADIATGEAVVFSEGHLPLAVRASMSIPAILSPVEWQGRLLVDGGIANNIPVDIARQMNVDRVIVVDIGSPLQTKEQLETVVNVLNQSVALLTRRNSEAQLATLQANDFLIQPEMSAFSITDFAKAAQMIEQGYQATMQMQPQLAVVASHRSQQWLADKPSRPLRITGITIENSSKVSDAVIRSYIRQAVNEPLDIEQLSKDLNTLYGLEYFEQVQYRLEHQAKGQAQLVIHAEHKRTGTDYLRLGLNLSDDLRGDSTFNLGASFRINGVNRLGAEWLTRLQLGAEQELYSEFYQPLDTGSRYFVSPWLQWNLRNIKQMQGKHTLAEYRLDRFRYGIDVGRQISNNGEIRLGLGSGWGDADVRVGSPDLPEYSFKEGYYQLSYAFDTLDNVDFPRVGEELQLNFRQHSASLGSDQSYRQWDIVLNKPLTLGANTWVIGGRYARTLDSNELINASYQIGGAQNLSGYQRNALAGQNVSLGRLIYYRRLTRENILPFSFPVYAGASIERGRAWDSAKNSHYDSGYINALSLFLTVDSPLGPVNFSYGLNTEHQNAFYLNLGHSF
ncbi:patatin-like phospholipase family protein [Thiopseudomonas alkaliphila]|uniref:patatin-like phospholipase family protein n=1 Tax=Thiopseudomonas alkaliphila TaxID=1697053 RepID=UPI003570A45B